MATADTVAPPVEEPIVPFIEDTEELEVKTTRSFWKVIKHRVNKTFFVVAGAATSAWKWTKHNTKKGARKTGHAAAVTGRGAAWVVTGALSLVGRALYATGRWVGLGAIYVVTGLMLVVVSIITAVAVTVQYAIFILIKVVHLVALLLCSPFIALHSTEALRADWELFLTGIKPRNLHIVHPTALAAATLLEREVKTSTRKDERKPAGSSDGQEPRLAKHQATEKKGHPTPRRATRRPPRLPVVEPGTA